MNSKKSNKPKEEKLTEHFSFEELTYTSNKDLKEINIEEGRKVKDKLIKLAEFAESVRGVLGCPMFITSGFRCEKLNKKVGGSKTSSHKDGFAVDLKPVNGLIDEFFEFVKKYFIENEIPFDQIIDEHSGDKHWVHIGYKNSKGEQRKQIKLYDNGTYYLLKYNNDEKEELKNEN